MKRWPGFGGHLSFVSCAWRGNKDCVDRTIPFPTEFNVKGLQAKIYDWQPISPSFP
jgi:hypothetical protein